MRAPSHAPAVRYPYGPSSAIGWALAIAAFSGLACLAAWLAWGTTPGEAMVLKAMAGLVLWCLCAVAAWRLWRGMPAGHLSWDGAQWALESNDQMRRQPLKAVPQAPLDLQACMLLCARPLQGGPVWLWLEQRRSPWQWAALRRALYSRARAEGLGTADVPITQGMAAQRDGRTQTKT